MATKRKIEEIEEIETEAPVNDNILPVDDELDELLATLGPASNATVTIYKPGDRYHNKPQYICTIPPSMFSLDYLRDELGGGTFRVYIRQGGKFIKNVEISTIEKEKPKEFSPDSGNNQILSAISEMGKSIGEGMAILAQAITQQQTANQIPQKSHAEQMQETVNLMLSMKEIIAPNPVQTQSEDKIEILLKGLELGKSIMSEASETTSLDLIKEAMQTFVPAIAQVSAVNAQKTNQNELQTIEKEKINKMKSLNAVKQKAQNVMIKNQLGQLVKAARKNSDPAPYAEIIYDNFTPPQIQKFIFDPEAMAKLIEINPEISQYGQWFDELKNCIGSIIAEEQKACQEALTAEDASGNLNVNE